MKYGIINKIVVYVNKIMFEMLFKNASSLVLLVKDQMLKTNVWIFVQVLMKSGKAQLEGVYVLMGTVEIELEVVSDFVLKHIKFGFQINVFAKMDS